MRIEMIRRTEQLLLTHQNIFDKDVRFQELFAQLQSRLSTLESRIDTLADNSAPLGPEKARLRALVVQKAVVLHEMIYHEAKETDKLGLMEVLSTHKAYANYGLSDLVERVQFLLRNTNAVKAELDKYSSSASLLSELNSALDALVSIGESPKGTIVKNAIERRAIYHEIAALTLFVRGAIRTVVRTKATDEPAFFALFKAYSRISGLSVYGSSSKKEVAVPTESEEASTDGETATAEAAAPAEASAETAAPATTSSAANNTNAEPTKTAPTVVKTASVKTAAAKKAANGQAQAAAVS